MQDVSPVAGESGFGRRRPRLSDEETERRMLQTAAQALSQSGLTVSLEHIRLEDVIRDAGVSRSAAYRRWPHKDLFLGDLLLELARAHAPLSSTGSREASDLVRKIVLSRLDRLELPERRRHLLIELVRETALLDFEHIYRSSQWRTYLALTVTFISLPPGQLREQVQQALAASEQAFTQRIAHAYQVIADLLDLRLTHAPQVSFETIAHLVNALMRGMIIKSLATPDLAAQRLAPNSAGFAGDWSLPALGLVGIVTTYLEPDPGAEWDQRRVTQLINQLESAPDLFARAG